jgi:hypothetical protein
MSKRLMKTESLQGHKEEEILPNPRQILEHNEWNYTMRNRTPSVVSICLPGGTEYLRHTACPAYDDCLQMVVLRKWKNWSCDRCQECIRHIGSFGETLKVVRGGL